MSVGTCPKCLPCGSINWLIENGRQLELFGGTGVLEPMRGLESIDKSAREQDEPDLRLPDGGLPF